jgi:PAS domain S-box-containing protein
MPIRTSPASLRPNEFTYCKTRLALSVRLTAVLALLAFGLVATVATTLVVTSEAGARLERQIGLNLAKHAALVAGSLDRSVYDRWRDIQTTATLDASRIVSGSDDDRRAVVERLKANQSDLAWVGYANVAGIVQAATGNLLVGQDVSARPWFAAGQAGMYAGDVHEAELLAHALRTASDEPLRFIDLAAPVRNADGQVAGVLAAHCAWSWARDLERSLRSTLDARLPGAEVFILARDGSVLLGPSTAPLGALPKGSGLDHLLREGWQILSTPNGQPALVSAAATQGFKDYPGLGWAVLVRQDAASALKPTADLRREMLLWGVGLSLILAAAAFAAGSYLVRPLGRLAAAASSLGRGEPVQWRTSPFRELHRVGEALAAASIGLREREAFLKGDRERYAFALEGANDGLWDWNVSTGEVWYSERWQTMLGYQPGELPHLFSSWEKLVHPEDKQGVLDALERHRSGLSPSYEAEHRLWHKEGRWVWILTRGKIVSRDSNGQPLRSVGTHTDVTRRKEAEESLRASETRFRTLFERAPIGIADVSLDCHVTQANDLLCQILGYSHEELIGKTFQDITHPDDVGPDEAQVRALLRGRIPFYSMEKRYIRKDGKAIWTHLSVGLVRDERGRAVHFLSSVKDISRRKAAAGRQEFLLALNEGLRGLSDPQAMMECATRLIAETLRVAQVGFGEIDEAQQNVTVHRDWNDGRVPSVVGTWRMDDFGSAFIIELKQGKTVSITDIRQDRRTSAPEVVTAYEAIATRSILDVPLVKDGRLRAILFIHEPEPRIWGQEETVLVEDACERLWSAVERARAELQLRESEVFARSVVESSPDCIKVLDLEGRLQFLNGPGRCAMEVDDFTCIQYGVWAELWPEETRPEVVRAIQAAAQGRAGRFTAFCPTMKGTPKWWDVSVTPVLGPNGKPARLLSISREITSMKQAEERLRLMMGELNHRVKNTLATVQAVVTLSARSADSVVDYKTRVLNRLTGLAKTNDLLTQSSWAGADLRTLLCSELDIYDDERGERVKLDGPEVALSARLAVSVSMVVHELTTNAAKYGALSLPQGRVAVSWRLRGENGHKRLSLTWVEQGGPPVTPPTRRGFGSKMIQEALARELNADIRVDYLSEGLRFSISTLIS